MVQNSAVKRIVLPWSARTDLRNKRNWTYDLNHPTFTGPTPQHVIDDEYEQRDMSPAHNSPPPHISPEHTAHGSCNTFAGAPSRFYYTEEMWWEQQALEEERDGLFYAMHEEPSNPY